MKNAALRQDEPARGHPFCLSAGLALAALVAVPARGADFSGSAQVATTATDNRGVNSDLLEQQYNLTLVQPLTPYLRLRVGYQYFDLGNSFADGTTFTRRTRRPFAELLYSRPRLSGRLTLYQFTAANTLEAENFDRRSVAGNLSWRPYRGPGFTVNFRKDKNVVDVSAFGRDTTSSLLELTTFYSRTIWSASYTFGRTAIDSPENAFESDQRRHEVRATIQKSLWADRFTLGASGRLSRLDRSSFTGQDTELADPIPSAAGLFAVDTNPDIGELDPAPGLVDGIVHVPAAPPIDIGGASIFRNIGLDLGVTRPVTRLEIAVDTTSGPSVTWQVYHSRDNLIWEPVPGVTSSFDLALLRYRLRFPSLEDRYFKAVNVSTNPVPNVLVTEIRALVDVDSTSRVEDLRGDVYRADVIATFHPWERVHGSVGAGLSTDETTAGGLVRRDYRDTNARALLTVALARDLDLNLGYRYNDSEDRRDPALLRTVTQYTAGLGYRPLPTVDAVLQGSVRDESREGTLLQSLRSIRLAVSGQILPDLRYVTDVDVARIEDPFAGRDRNSWSWRHTLEMRPVPSLSLNGSFTFSRNESLSGESLLDRKQYRVWTTWNASSYLTLTGTLWYNDDGGENSLNQSYALSYAPGDRLTISATYQGYEAFGGVATATDSLSATYRLFTRFILFANLSRSRSADGDEESTRISNLRLGLLLSF